MDMNAPQQASKNDQALPAALQPYANEIGVLSSDPEVATFYRQIAQANANVQNAAKATPEHKEALLQAQRDAIHNFNGYIAERLPHDFGEKEWEPRTSRDIADYLDRRFGGAGLVAQAPVRLRHRGDAPETIRGPLDPELEQFRSVLPQLEADRGINAAHRQMVEATQNLATYDKEHHILPNRLDLGISGPFPERAALEYAVGNRQNAFNEAIRTTLLTAKMTGIDAVNVENIARYLDKEITTHGDATMTNVSLIPREAYRRTVMENKPVNMLEENSTTYVAPKGERPVDPNEAPLVVERMQPVLAEPQKMPNLKVPVAAPLKNAPASTAPMHVAEVKSAAAPKGITPNTVQVSQAPSAVQTVPMYNDLKVPAVASVKAAPVSNASLHVTEVKPATAPKGATPSTINVPQASSATQAAPVYPNVHPEAVHPVSTAPAAPIKPLQPVRVAPTASASAINTPLHPPVVQTVHPSLPPVAKQAPLQPVSPAPVPAQPVEAHPAASWESNSVLAGLFHSVKPTTSEQPVTPSPAAAPLSAAPVAKAVVPTAPATPQGLNLAVVIAQFREDSVLTSQATLAKVRLDTLVDFERENHLDTPQTRMRNPKDAELTNKASEADSQLLQLVTKKLNDAGYHDVAPSALETITQALEHPEAPIPTPQGIKAAPKQR